MLAPPSPSTSPTPQVHDELHRAALRREAREIVSYFHVRDARVQTPEEEPEPLTEPEIQQVIQSQPVRADSSDSEEVLFTTEIDSYEEVTPADSSHQEENSLLNSFTPPRDPSPPSDA